MLISPEYIDQYRELHRRRDDYGGTGGKWMTTVLALIMQSGFKSALDYGCGKAALWAAIVEYLPSNFSWQNYDPCMEEYEDPPRPADLVICTDVLEHIEPDCLDHVLDDLARCTKKEILFNVATRPADNRLPNGQNAHLIQEPISWWWPHLLDRWRAGSMLENDGEFSCTLTKNEHHSLR
jgi:hypothetical protein